MVERAELGPRKSAVLHAIVEEYVRSGEPVGSETIAEQAGIGVYSATIRNEMAALEEQGLDRSATCFFSCLGVSQYLRNEAVDRIFQFVASFPHESAIVCSFIQPDAILTAEDLAEAQVSAANAAEHGEPWMTRFNPS